MSASTLAPAADQDAATRGIWASVVRTRQGRVGIAIALLIVVMVIVGPQVAPYPPNETGTGPPASGPSSDHPFGTDALGRDVLSRVLNGGSSLLLVALVGTSAGWLIGALLGVYGAYRRGPVDGVVARVFDGIVTIPPLLLALVLVFALGTSEPVLILVLAVTFIPTAGRTMRGAALAGITEDYVSAARARGESTASVLMREVAPNLAGPGFAHYAISITYGILSLAALSFLGLGVQPPTPDWAVMVSESRGIITLNGMAVMAPALAIAAISIGISLIADAVAHQVSGDELALGAQR